MTKKNNQKTTNVKNKHPGGRPTKYTPALGEQICEALAITTKGIASICNEHPNFPCRDTIFEWRLKYPQFADRYAEAKRIQADLFAEEITELADNCDGRLDTNKTRLQIDTRKWIACKLMPKVYGDKVQNDTTITLSHEKALEQLK